MIHRHIAIHAVWVGLLLVTAAGGVASIESTPAVAPEGVFMSTLDATPDRRTLHPSQLPDSHLQL